MMARESLPFELKVLLSYHAGREKKTNTPKSLDVLLIFLKESNLIEQFSRPRTGLLLE
jgi:hypothetical protein